MAVLSTKSIELEKRIKDFCRSHEKVYIYGAGWYGKICFQYLQKRNIHVDGFITTEGGDEVLGTPVYKADEVLGTLQAESGILFALKQQYQEEVKRDFLILCDIMPIYKEEYFYLEAIISLEDITAKNSFSLAGEISDKQWKNILVVQLEVTFGDMIWSTAFYRELRRNFPDSYITLIMNPQLMELYRLCPYIDRIVPYECDTMLQHISNEMIAKTVQFMENNFKEIFFDVVFLPRLLPVSYQDSWENVLLAFASKAKNRIAHAMYFVEPRKYLCDTIAGCFSLVVKHTEAKHEVLNDLDMLTACGLQYEDDKMELWISDKDKEFAESIFSDISEDELCVAVAMVGSKRLKSWDPCRYGKVFDDMSKKYRNKVKFILCGGKDASDAATVVSEEQKKNCVDITSKTSLPEVAAVISKCNIYLGSDTGLMHMASVFGVPIINITACNMDAPDYWDSSPTRVGPWKVDSIVLRPERGLDDCKYMCSKQYSHCINQVTVEQVVEALEEMIGKVKSSNFHID